jgi:alpha-1,2-mannosyltransferase
MIFPRPHKEERFLFPVYHLLAFSAALSLRHAKQLAPHPVLRRFVVSPLFLLLPAVFGAVSFCRIAALSHNYGAPISVYTMLHDRIAAAPLSAPPATVCVGGEWHRFPSHFFLPGHASLGFVESSFKGQLPQPFTEGGSAVPPPQPFNALNREEPSRYTPVHECR